MYEPEVFGRTATAVIEVKQMRLVTLHGFATRSDRRTALAGRRPRCRRSIDQRHSHWLCGSACGPIPDQGCSTTARSTSTVVVDRNGVPLYEALSATARAAIDARPRTRFRRCSSRRPSPPRTAASGRIPASIRSPSLRALKRNVVERSGRRGRLDDLAAGREAAAQHASRRRRRRGVSAKIHEAVIALRLEHRFSKREILAMYLNLAAYGNQIVGVERASRALLRRAGVDAHAGAGGVPGRTAAAPVRLQPLSQSRRRARRGSARSLARMEAAGALAARPGARSAGRAAGVHRADDAVRCAALRRDGACDRGDRARARSRRRSTRACRRTSPASSAAIGRMLSAHGAHNVAVVVLDNRTRRVAGVGRVGRLLRRRAAAARSTAPLDAAAAGLGAEAVYLRAGVRAGLHPGDACWPTCRRTFPTAEPGVRLQPAQLRRPLSRSAAARVGAGRIRKRPRRGARIGARRAGAAAISAARRVDDVRQDRGVLRPRRDARQRRGAARRARRGVRGVRARRRVDRARPYRAQTLGRRCRGHSALVSPRTAFWITDILSDADAREYIFGRGGSLEFPFPVAVKTGTSQAYHDNWTIGYSRDVTVGVWVGNFDRTPLRNSSGVTGAGPIFHAVMLAAEKRAARGANDSDVDPFQPMFDTDARVQSIEICALSGLAANPWCPARRREWVAAETTPLPCSWHHLTDGGLLTVWPAQYRQWARDHGMDLEVRHSGESMERVVAVSLQSKELRISSPPDGATYLIDPTLRREFQALALRAVTTTPGPVQWTVDERSLAASTSDRTTSWPLVPGRHTFRARDAAGQIAEATIVVR